MFNTSTMKFGGLLLALLCYAAPSQAQINESVWCTHVGAQRLNADINGDGSIDALCHDRNTGHKWVALRYSTGLFQVWENPTAAFCRQEGASLYLADVNGDGRADLVCKDPRSIAIDYYEGDFYGGPRPGDTISTPWCTHTGTVFLGVADQNGDGRADLVCKDYTSGYFWVDYADARGRYFNTDVERFSPDFRITTLRRTATGLYMQVHNDSAVAGYLRQIECALNGSPLSTWASTMTLTGNTFASMSFSLPAYQMALISAAPPEALSCRVIGTTLAGLPEVHVSNNAKSGS